MGRALILHTRRFRTVGLKRVGKRDIDRQSYNCVRSSHGATREQNQDWCRNKLRKERFLCRFLGQSTLAAFLLLAFTSGAISKCLCRLTLCRKISVDSDNEERHCYRAYRKWGSAVRVPRLTSRALTGSVTLRMRFPYANALTLIVLMIENR